MKIKNTTSLVLSYALQALATVCDVKVVGSKVVYTNDWHVKVFIHCDALNSGKKSEAVVTIHLEKNFKSGLARVQFGKIDVSSIKVGEGSKELVQMMFL